jgi:hypothetical protein
VTTTTRWGAVVDALVTLCRTTDAALVLDGPTVTGDRPADYIVVGGTEDPEADGGEFTQDWNGLGARTKHETGTVTCAVLAGIGDSDVKLARDRALNVLGQVETAIRADPTLAGAVSSGWCHVAAGRPSQHSNANGTYVRVVFDIAYQSKI